MMIRQQGKSETNLSSLLAARATFAPAAANPFATAAPIPLDDPVTIAT